MQHRQSRQVSPFLSRKSFLKLSGLGLASLLLPNGQALAEPYYDLQGRVIESNVALYDIPSFSGNKLKLFWKDMILPINQVTVGDDHPAYNRIWYRIREEGYVHSGVIQPVRTGLNNPKLDIPPEGILAEVSVPFTDARWRPGRENELAYRCYYATTYWVMAVHVDGQGAPWYQVLEDKWDYVFYIPAQHLRLISPEEISPLSPQIPEAGKRLEVRTAEQVLIAYEWERPVFMARVATGAKFSNGDYSTPPGRHITFHKRPSRHMASGNLAANGYDLPGVPWVTYFTEEGVSIHGTYWHNDYGLPRSHGCINLTPQAAKWVYRWTEPVVPYNQQKVWESYGTALDVV